ncbi:MAG: hypothetical protein K8I00_03700 [Candidatus Omnitrophica bacterium]|nr:hypothetical protein [Candidatus Omnitrophota bacterium]
MLIIAVGAVAFASTAGAETKDSWDEILAEDVTFDAETGRITYTLPEAALVRIRIGLPEGGPLLSNLIDWEHQEAGPQEVVWNFRDKTGKVNFGTKRNYILTIKCFPAPIKQREGMNTHVAGYRHEPKFDVTFPESELTKGIPQMDHLDPIRVMLAEEDRRWLTETKYEVALFIDNVLLMEEEEGINPFTYRLDTRGFRAGKHKITLTIVGYEGEIGTQSFWIHVVN